VILNTTIHVGFFSGIGVAVISYINDPTGINWPEAVDVLYRAPLGQRRDPEQLRLACLASYAAVFAFDGQTLVGMARATSDGVFQAAVYDMVVLPEYQGQGIGREILKRLCDQLPVDNIILYAVPGREEFYSKCGFRKMRTAMAKLNPNMSRPESGYLE
jgi:GNAT superfamily N-acetyltransferase